MKAVILIGLLAVSAAEYSVNLKDAELIESSQPETTTKPFPLQVENYEIERELKSFGRQFIVYSLNLDNIKCGYCFPFSIFGQEIEYLLAVKSLLIKIYGTEYEHLVQQDPIGDYNGTTQRPLHSEFFDIHDKILDTWKDIWFALENRTFEKYDEQQYAQTNVVMSFSSTFGDDRMREANRRFLHVFGPTLDETTDDQSPVNPMRFYEQPAILSHTRRSVSYDGIPHEIEQKQLVEKIHTFIRRMYTYVFDLDPLGKDYMTGFIADHLKGFSIKSLLIFDHYLEKTFGKAMSEIPEKPLPSAQERREKVQIVRELKDMMTTTLNVWQKDLSVVMQKDVELDKDYEKSFDSYVSLLPEFMNLEDLRRVFRKATPILGWAKKPIVIPEKNV